MNEPKTTANNGGAGVDGPRSVATGGAGMDGPQSVATGGAAVRSTAADRRRSRALASPARLDGARVVGNTGRYAASQWKCTKGKSSHEAPPARQTTTLRAISCLIPIAQAPCASGAST